jgi:hypothetical protein
LQAALRAGFLLVVIFLGTFFPSSFWGAGVNFWLHHTMFRLGNVMQLLDYNRYGQLASPLVKQGVWADSDDYRLVEA